MSILIFGSHEDPHVAGLDWALAQLGRRSVVLDYSAFPVEWHNSCEVDERGLVRTSSRSAGLGEPVWHEAFDTVWNRRAHPVSHRTSLAQPEVDMARTVSRLHLDNMRALEKAGQIWVNPRRQQREIDNKIEQLRLAASLGLRIPRTLISNDPAEVWRFVEQCPSAIVKPITPMFWNIDDHVRAMATREVTLADLQSDSAVSACPMIYQEKVEKLFELRITFFGDEFVCGRP